ncbi:MAG: GDP-L-fucose synthase [Alphaproteobacteria bacterium]|nr:GDP-L-fucose synthase [Alphaproteobacteria bacterium]
MSERVLVTGGAGFLGSHVVDRLRARGAEVFAPRSADYDLREAEACARVMADARPTRVIHCAVDGGGIGYMRAHPAEVMRNNLLMNTNLLHAAWTAGVARFVGVSSVCAYPRITPIPMQEENLFAGYPEPSNAAYGLSKRAMMEMGRAYHQQHGFTCVFPMPTNLYGPRDDFEPRRSHVVPALIRRCLEARERGADHIVAWGTGRATRELLYVEDCADAILAMADRWESPEPLNIGNGREVPVRELVETIARVCGYGGEIRWDTTKPDGQPRKCLDVSRAREGLGWAAQVDLEEGLARTVAWYLSKR